MLRLYNTLTREIEEFKPLKLSEVGYYSCGPTVYDFAHIGHCRTYIFADIMQRVLELNGYDVKRVMNITDVGHLTSDSDSGEDKMEKGAKRENKSVWDIAEYYTQDFFNMMTKLNIKKPEIICKATDYIPQMVELVKKLEEKGFTYTIADGVYFDTSKLTDYGKLTGKTFAQLEKNLKGGARVEIVAGKKNITDFALWKLTPDGVKRQMEWESPWGGGFPGWHIECSAMSMHFLGETLDIHTGGVDHIPIHHTNEIAQSEAASGKQFVKYWLHSAHLMVEGEKMSKSLGNFYRLSDIEAKGYQPLALRYLFLQASYRFEMNFTWESLEAASHAYKNLMSALADIKKEVGNEIIKGSNPQLKQLKQQFIEAVNDDLNTAEALAVTWSVIKSDLTPAEKYQLISYFDTIFALDLAKAEVAEKNVPDDIKELVGKRESLRRGKKYEEADKVRQQIEARGYIVEDTGGNAVIRKK